MTRIPVLFPEAAIELQSEIYNNHPALSQKLAQAGQNIPLEEKVAIIATYCDFYVDGPFREKDLKNLFELLLKKLKKKSMIIVN